jgi:Xaa-Pro aminopeptidase
MYKERRAQFMEKMSKGVAFFKSAPVANRNHDVDHKYRQDSDFYYLTGFEEPESYLLLAPEHPEHKVVMFVRPRDKEKEIWTGKRAGTEGAKADYGADEAYTLDKLEETLPKYFDNADTVYYSMGKDLELDRKVLQQIHGYRTRARSGVSGPYKVIDAREILHEMRLIKTEEELSFLKRAIDISCEGHLEAMKATRVGMYEYEIEAIIEHTFRKRGSPRNGYPSIVGSGPHTITLHYDANNRRMEDGELLLIDAGAEYNFYTGDITRTFPVTGRFSPEQKQIYELVLQAQLEAIDLVKPGSTIEEVHNRAVEVITEGLVALGLLQGNVKELIEKNDYRKFYMHRTSHWLGMDVHDVGRYAIDGKSRVLEPGMVLTVEPGIYIAEGTESASSQYWNIGVRIEDDVLVTSNGHEVLTAKVPKRVEDIEAMKK